MAKINIFNVFYNIIRLLKRCETICSTSVSLPITYTKLINGYVMDSCTCYLYQNLLTVYINYHKTSAVTQGQITDIIPWRFTITHNGKLRGGWNACVMSGSSGPLTSGSTTNMSSTDTTFTFEYKLTSIGQSNTISLAANSQCNAMIVVPVLLKTSGWG